VAGAYVGQDAYVCPVRRADGSTFASSIDAQVQHVPHRDPYGHDATYNPDGCDGGSRIAAQHAPPIAGVSIMVHILGLSGSLRSGSYNSALLRAATEVIGSEATLEIGSIRGIPLYDGDVEAADGIPAAVQALKARMLACDGLLLVTPEYNNGIPGVFKNAIDWLSRPAAEIPQVFGDRAVALVGASPGGFGTILSQNAWLPVLRTLGTWPWFGAKLMVSRANKAFDADGVLVDDAVRAQLRDYLAGFVRFVAESKRTSPP
jgi:NAD(P)H-dependent FMN reductase